MHSQKEFLERELKNTYEKASLLELELESLNKENIINFTIGDYYKCNDNVFIKIIGLDSEIITLLKINNSENIDNLLIKISRVLFENISFDSYIKITEIEFKEVFDNILNKLKNIY